MSRFRQRKPSDVEEALSKCGVTLRHLDSGAFRKTYQVGELPLVVKFPRNTSGIAHSAIEMRVHKRIKRARKRYKPLLKYMPTIYHHEPVTGVIVMRMYTPLGWNDTNSEICHGLEEKIANAIKHTKWAAKWGLDCSPTNVGRDAKGKLVLLDLGCFEDQVAS